MMYHRIYLKTGKSKRGSVPLKYAGLSVETQDITPASILVFYVFTFSSFFFFFLKANHDFPRSDMTYFFDCDRCDGKTVIALISSQNAVYLICFC